MAADPSSDRRSHPDLEAFQDGYGFPLDDFQVAGVGSLIDGRSVLVAAPTGAGKTVVGEFAVWEALARGGKCFYTTPIKALSNQKFGDLARRHGAHRVGLLTGDNVVNSEAPVVVMTTEVLRNMLYEGSPTLRGLQYVVLDEVHYLADRERGAVWEEVIIQLPLSVQLACLSATVSNAEEFGSWLAQVREGCDVVISERRPVPLDHHYAVNDRLYPMYRAGGAKAGKRSDASKVHAARQARGGVPNPEVLLLERRSNQRNRYSNRGRPQASDVKLRPPRRSDLVRNLSHRRWLPAIYFLFSRDGCDAAVGQLVSDGVRLTSGDEQRQIAAIVDQRTAELPPADLEALGYGRWASALELGIAAHHAGIVPIFKETVEQLFLRGLVKICFATETLALGINMPARTVVIERLEKWNGQRHELLTPGQFTQLTGRAGRRGLDELGHAVVAYQRDVEFGAVASLVGRRTEPLVSRFTPSYNMAVNLLRRHDRPEAERLLARSFAQFQTDVTVAADSQRIARNREALEGYGRNLVSQRGDFGQYWELRRELSRVESDTARSERRRRTQGVVDALAELVPGDVLELDPADGYLAAVVETTTRDSGTPLARIVSSDKRLSRIGPRDFDTPPRRVGRIKLPKGSPRQTNYRKVVAAHLRGFTPAWVAGNGPADGDGSAGAGAGAAQRVTELRALLRQHPVHDDPELADIERWAYRHDALAAETERLDRAVRNRTGSLVRRFGRIVGVLSDLGYLAEDEAADSPRPTEDGLRLAGLYSETDLVLAECLRKGIMSGLGAADLAAVASMFTYVTRGRDVPPPVLPSAAAASALIEIERTHAEVVAREEDADLPPTRPVDAGFAEAVWRWAAGAELDQVLDGTDLTAGDFVRDTKQVADLLRQLRDAARPDRELAATANEAARTLFRGVVAYSGT